MTVLPGEPVLDVNDIQGHISPGFGSAHSVVIGFRLDDAAAGRSALAPLIPEITTISESLRDKEARRAALRADLGLPNQPLPSLALSLAASALRAWGYDVSGLDFSFREGMLRDARSLRDPLGPGDIPADWTFARDAASRIDLLLVGGHSMVEALDRAVDHWCLTLAPHWTPVFVERGRRREGDKEFFGFKDGVSQPDMRGIAPDGAPLNRRVIDPADPRSLEFSRPGHRLVWPGAFVFGYPREISMFPMEPGPIAEPPQPWMRNGSYLVFRRLLQDVPAFEAAIAALEDHLRSLGEDPPPGWVAARLVGRWPDGTPLHVSPDAPDPDIGGNRNRANNFLFAAATPETKVLNMAGGVTVLPSAPADLRGRHLPRVSHIRQVNPRDGQSEIGASDHPGKLVLRRGIAFGPEFEENPGADRGLLFLCYQTSIEQQFKFLQVNWANSDLRPTSDGPDPIISQDGTTQTRRRLKFAGPSGRNRTCPFDGRWVVATGGEYFFAPGIAALRDICAA